MDEKLLPNDIVLKKKAETALENLIAQVKSGSVDSELIQEGDSILTGVVLDDLISAVTKRVEEEKPFRLEILNNYPISRELDGTYQVELGLFKEAQIDGEKDPSNLQYLLKLHYDLGATNIQFRSPFYDNTNSWKRKQYAEVLYIFRDKIDQERAETFAKINQDFAKKFEQEVAELRFVMAENYQEILKLMGIEFDASSIGKTRDGLGVLHRTIFSIENNEDFSHDLFHFYSEMKQKDAPRNWVAEEGLAYSWGHPYYSNSTSGEMITQAEMIKALRKYSADKVKRDGQNTDYLLLLEDNFWKDSSGILTSLAPDIKIGRLISSVLCDSVESKWGMKGVNELITSGKEPDHHQPFLISIEKQLGINRENFNEKFVELLKQYP